MGGGENVSLGNGSGPVRQFLWGAVSGTGVGLLFGWSLGKSELIPNEGWPLWAVTLVGMALIFAGGIGNRPRPPAV